MIWKIKHGSLRTRPDKPFPQEASVAYNRGYYSKSSISINR